MVLLREVNDVSFVVDKIDLPSCPRMLSMTLILTDVVQCMKSSISFRKLWMD